MTRRHFAGEEPNIRASLSLLGIPLQLETNAPEVLAAARAAYGEERASVHRSVTSAPRLRIEVVSEAAEPGARAASGEPPPTAEPPASAERRSPARPASGGPPPTAELPHVDRLVLRGACVDAEADAERGVATARVSASALDAVWFRASVLDHLALFLVTRFDRTPIHAAAVVRGGTALLVAGASGVGKSSLTYAAMRAGYGVLTEDAVYVQLHPSPRLWAMPRRIHLPDSAIRHFPELTDAERVLRPDGRTKLAVPISRASRVPVPWTGRVALCLLATRDTESDVWRTVSAEDAAAELRDTLQGGFHRFEDRLDECARAVTGAGCWRLSRGEDPMELLGRVEQALVATVPDRPGG